MHFVVIKHFQKINANTAAVNIDEKVISDLEFIVIAVWESNATITTNEITAAIRCEEFKDDVDEEHF